MRETPGTARIAARASRERAIRRLACRSASLFRTCKPGSPSKFSSAARIVRTYGRALSVNSIMTSWH